MQIYDFLFKTVDSRMAIYEDGITRFSVLRID